MSMMKCREVQIKIKYFFKTKFNNYSIDYIF